MKERPIVFSGPMARATWLDLKTQTRRLGALEQVNARPDAWRLRSIGTLGYMARERYKGRFGAYFESEEIEPGALTICPVVSPYGQPGDRLWVRETWTPNTVLPLRGWRR